MRYLLILLLSGCASAPIVACQSASGYALAVSVGYPTFLLFTPLAGYGCGAAFASAPRRPTLDYWRSNQDRDL